jgi:hypothetical protein
VILVANGVIFSSKTTTDYEKTTVATIIIVLISIIILISIASLLSLALQAIGLRSGANQFRWSSAATSQGYGTQSGNKPPVALTMTVTSTADNNPPKFQVQSQPDAHLYIPSPLISFLRQVQEDRGSNTTSEEALELLLASKNVRRFTVQYQPAAI